MKYHSGRFKMDIQKNYVRYIQKKHTIILMSSYSLKITWTNIAYKHMNLLRISKFIRNVLLTSLEAPPAFCRYRPPPPAGEYSWRRGIPAPHCRRSCWRRWQPPLWCWTNCWISPPYWRTLPVLPGIPRSNGTLENPLFCFPNPSTFFLICRNFFVF